MNSISLLSGEGIFFLLRWMHFFFGIIWIGLLYYFNFVQGAFFAETDATTKSNAIQKLLPRALWWFRWGAMGTFLTGWIYLMGKSHVGGLASLQTSYGLMIGVGATLATLMWANVWFVIWPCQKIVIASTALVASGKSALPNAALSATKALLASRTNTLFSIPMLFFMGAASHLPINFDAINQIWILIGGLAVIIGALEYNALFGKLGPLTTVKGVIHCGFALAVVIYAWIELMTFI